MGAAATWRETLRKSRAMLIFESLDTAMIQLVAVADGAQESGWGNVDLNQVVSVAKVLPVIANGLANSVDEVEELLFNYAPELLADREWIEENAYDTEAIAAFVEVLKLCFPILGILALINGPKVPPTATNSPSRNGGSGQSSIKHRTKA